SVPENHADTGGGRNSGERSVFPGCAGSITLTADPVRPGCIFPGGGSHTDAYTVSVRFAGVVARCARPTRSAEDDRCRTIDSDAARSARAASVRVDFFWISRQSAP